MASRSSHVRLLNFFVFNSTYGPKEGQEAKRILYYYPGSVAIEKKISQIGLCEGIIQFTRTFSDCPIEAVHTQKTRQLFHEPEKNFWIILTVSIPCIEKTIDGKSYWEYQEDEVQDDVMQCILVQIYRAFRLFNGTMLSILARSDKTGLIQHLEHFFNKYLATLQLSHIGVLEMFNGIQYLPLDKYTYSRIHSFISQLKSVIPQVAYAILLHNDQQIWSDLDQEDTRVMFNYLSLNLFPAAATIESQNNGGSSVTAQAVDSQGWFLIGPSNMADESSMGRIPKVHLTETNENVECFLVIYRVNGTTLCMLINGFYQISFDFMRKIDKYCTAQLAATSADVAEHCPKKQPTTAEYKYIYFNRMNMAEKTSSSVCGKNLQQNFLPENVHRIIGQIYSDFTEMDDHADGEIIAKMSNDCWVIGKKSGQREVYITTNQKNSNLADFHEEVKKICATNFSNIFFQD